MSKDQQRIVEIIHRMLDENGKDICIERRYCYRGYIESNMDPGRIKRHLGLANDPSFPNGYIAIGLKGSYAIKYNCVDVIKRLYKQSGE